MHCTQSYSARHNSKPFIQQLLEAMSGRCKKKTSPRRSRATINANALTSKMYHTLVKALLLQSPLGLQPLSIIFGPHVCKRFRQVNVLHLVHLRPLFQGIVQHHPQCGIQLSAMYSALTQLSNEHMILLGVGKDKQIIMKVSVHMMMLATMLRFVTREEVVQDLEHCRYPRSGGIRNTMNGDHWAVLCPLLNAIQVPAE